VKENISNSFRTKGSGRLKNKTALMIKGKPLT
jgi:hypothetical protein